MEINKVNVTPGARNTIELIYPKGKQEKLTEEAKKIAFNNERSSVYVVDVLSAYKFLENLK
jgi:hypothetical protein